MGELPVWVLVVWTVLVMAMWGHAMWLYMKTQRDCRRALALIDAEQAREADGARPGGEGEAGHA